MPAPVPLGVASSPRPGRGFGALGEQRGAVSIQVALVVMPALFAVLILALQFSFAWMAATAVQAAAENAADAASARPGLGSTPGERAREAADRVLDAAGYATVTGFEVDRGTETVRVEITARAYQFLPVAWEVQGAAEAGLEEFRSSEERR
jgi:Flp pilus assembly protein TadG